MTRPGTNTYIVGAEPLCVIDPGQDTDGHFDALLKAIGPSDVAGAAPAHAHPDHWPMAPRLVCPARGVIDADDLDRTIVFSDALGVYQIERIPG